jgi:signal transduction histidine kinase
MSTFWSTAMSLHLEFPTILVGAVITVLAICVVIGMIFHRIDKQRLKEETKRILEGTNQS